MFKHHQILSWVLLASIFVSPMTVQQNVNAAVAYNVNDNYDSDASVNTDLYSVQAGGAATWDVAIQPEPFRGNVLSATLSGLSSTQQRYLIRKNISPSITVNGTDKYIFEIDFYNDSKAGDKWFFQHGPKDASTPNDSSAPVRMRNMKSSEGAGGDFVYLCYPDDTLIGAVGEAGSQTVDGSAKIPIKTWNTLTVVQDFGVKRETGIYINGVEPEGIDYTKYPVDNWYGTTATQLRLVVKGYSGNTINMRYDNFKVFKITPIEIESHDAIDGFSPLKRKINISFSNIINTSTTGTIGPF